LCEGTNLDSGPVTVASGATLNLGGVDTFTPASSISGQGNLLVSGGAVALNGQNTYTGDTTIANGVLALSGSGSIANSPDIIIAGGATFDVSALSSAFTLSSSQTLSNSTSTGTLTCGSVGAATGSGTLSMTYASGAPHCASPAAYCRYLPARW
jgi:fibronectin-binding autotransporter adhesin